MKKILLVGEAMTLLIAKEYGKLDNVSNFEKRVAGAELNVCMGLTRLGYETQYLTKLGNDPFGRSIKTYIEDKKIKLANFEFDNYNKTGMMLKGKIENGDPEIYYFRKNSAASKICPEDIEKLNFKDIDLVHITGISLAISKSFREAMYKLIELARKNNIMVTFDPNLRPSMWDSEEEMIKVINDISSKADVVMPGISEARILLSVDKLEDIRDAYMKMGVENIVVKLGSSGSAFISPDGIVIEKGFKVEKVIDTVGAGDGFAVGIISGLLEGLDKNKILERANAIGSIQVQHVSDNEGLPTREELEEYIQLNKERRSN